MQNHVVDYFNSLGAKAAIFDLDGTLVDNNAVHLKTWLQYLANEGIQVSEEEYRLHFNGRTNKDALEYIYQRSLSVGEALEIAERKEALYRKNYQDSIQPIDGLLEFLATIHEAGIPIAMATSGIQPNIDFLFEHLPIQHYFKVIVNSSHIQKGKPDPEIYLKAANLLGVEPKHCLVFEDAVVGIQSAKAAGMKVIAITSTETLEALSIADKIIPDFLAENFQ